MSYASSICSLLLVATCASLSSCAWYSSVRQTPEDKAKKEAAEQAVTAEDEAANAIVDQVLDIPAPVKVEASQPIAPPPVDVRSLNGIKFAEPDVTRTLPSDKDAQPKFNGGVDEKKDSVILAVPQTSQNP